MLNGSRARAGNKWLDRPPGRRDGASDPSPEPCRLRAMVEAASLPGGSWPSTQVRRCSVRTGDPAEHRVVVVLSYMLFC